MNRDKLLSGATFSYCVKYRYKLWRIWDPAKPIVLFIMLNPSTADGSGDDHTIRRCIRFAQNWGYGGIYVGNLYAFRTKSPSVLIEAQDPIGEGNMMHLKEMDSLCQDVVYAWGNSHTVRNLHKRFPDYNPLQVFTSSTQYYIELNQDGTPSHPLYLKATSLPKLYLK